MPLPLTIRKAIRDSEPQLKEALEKINNATGKEFVFECDWETQVNNIDPSYKDSIGSLYQKEIMGNFADCIETNMKDPLIKEAFNEVTTNNKIIIRVNDKMKDSYNQLKFENGDIVIEHKKSLANLHEVSYFPIPKLLPTQSGSLPMPVRLNIEENKERQQELLESIASITGSGEWVFEVDWLGNSSKLEKSQQESIGSLYVKDILGGVETLLKDKLANETLKEAFNEATPNRTITILVNPKINGYWDTSIKDGGLLIQHKPSIANTHEVSYFDLASVIPVPGIISLVAKLNLEEKKDKLTEALEKIKEATGEEFTFDESSLQEVYPKLDEYSKKRVGDLVYGDFIPNLAENLSKAMADEMVKEAFLEVATSHTIKIQVNPKQSGYWDIKFVNGDIILSSNGNIANTHEISYFNIEKLL